VREERERGREGGRAVATSEPTLQQRLLPPTLPHNSAPRAQPPDPRGHSPSTTRVAECPGMSTGCPLESKRPRRGPTMMQPTRPVRPPTMCTTAQPVVWFVGGGWGLEEVESLEVVCERLAAQAPFEQPRRPGNTPFQNKTAPPNADPPATPPKHHPPAKSIIPEPNRGLVVLKADSQPLGAHTQCTTTGYTHAEMSTVYAKYALKLKRSATAPAGMVAAVAANAHWKNHSAQRPLAPEGLVLPYQPERPKAMSPMKGLPLPMSP